MDEAGAAAEGPLEAMLARGMAYVRFGLENPEHYRILFMSRAKQAPASFGAEELERSASFEHMVETVQAGIDAGVLRPGNARLMTIALWASAHGIVSLLIAMPRFPWPEPLWLAEQLLHFQGHALLTKEALAAHEDGCGDLMLDPARWQTHHPYAHVPLPAQGRT